MKEKDYASYVGKKIHWDQKAAMQFRLLCSFGLRQNHKLLDFGCGSLRAGRLFIPYLESGNYYGVEPNKWLIDDAIENEIGSDLVRLKGPNFFYNDDFSCPPNTEKKFDFILAQSIFSHSGISETERAISQFASAAKDSGIILVTFVPADKNFAHIHNTDKDGWAYPGCFSYDENQIDSFFKKSNLHYKRLRWYHNTQNWYVASKDPKKIPTDEKSEEFTGTTYYKDNYIASPKDNFHMILGMHRSGTSLTSGIISLSGVKTCGPETYTKKDTGEVVHINSNSLTPPENRVLFEDCRIWDINNKILNLCGGRWNEPPDYDTIKNLENQEVKSEAWDYLKKIYEENEGHKFCLKDPRLALTMPWWCKNFPNLFSRKVIWPTRNKEDIVGSLMDRDEWARLDPKKTQDVVNHYIVSIERIISELAEESLKIEYEEILKYPELYHNKICDFLEIDNSFNRENVMEWIRPAFRRNSKGE